MLLLIIGIVLSVATFVGLGIKKVGSDYRDEKYVWGLDKKQLLSLVVLAVFTFVSCFKTVPTGNTGVITVFGKVQDQTLEAGMHMLNPIAKVISIDNRTQKTTVSLGAFSSDIQEVTVVYTLNYSIDKANAQELYKTIGLNYLETVVQPKIVENVKSVFAKYTAENLVGSRSEVAKNIEEELSDDLRQYNIQLVGTAIEDIDFTDVFTDAVEAKQVAEQNKLRVQTEAETKKLEAEKEAEVRKIQADTDAEVRVIEAQSKADALLVEAKAQAEANELLSQSLTDKVLKQESIDKWNGNLPTVISDNSNILDLTGMAK